MTKKSPSIQFRLLKSLLIGLPLLWLGIATSISISLWHEINTLNDSQIVQLSRYLTSISADKNQKKNQQPTIYQLDDEPLDLDNDELLSDNIGKADDDYLGFAIWDKHGNLLMADDNGKNFQFLPNQHGFVDKNYALINPFSEDWRILYYQSDNNRIIAVGQNLANRQEVLINALIMQSLPMFIGLLAFLALVFWSVRQGFAPLKKVSDSLIYRNPQDDTPLILDAPKEIQPLVQSLNQLFVKVADTLEREKRFTADASHELRSPLTALKLQAELLEQKILQSQLHHTDEETLFHHTQQLQQGIERANHLVEQLLTLAKLNPEQGFNKNELVTIDWLTLSDNALSEVNRNAREKHSQLKREILDNQPLPLTGNPVLLQLLLRNLLDNAVRYCPENATIILQLSKNSISVIDNGKGVSEQDLKRLSERFFRPAGQHERGSGLGLSIVTRIAQLHGLNITIDNRRENGEIVGFQVTLHQ